jgi:hypothetical protein
MARGGADAIVKHAGRKAMADAGMLALIIAAFGLAAAYARLCGGLLPPADRSHETDS